MMRCQRCLPCCKDPQGLPPTTHPSPSLLCTSSADPPLPQLHPPPQPPQPTEATPGARPGASLEKRLGPGELQMAGMAGMGLPPGLDEALKLPGQLPPDQEDPTGPPAAGLLTGRLRDGLRAAAVGDGKRSSVAGKWGWAWWRRGSILEPGFWVVHRGCAATLAQRVCQLYTRLAV